MNRRSFREAFRWYGVVLIGCVLSALLVVTVINAIQRAEAAEAARASTSAKATRRIDLLNARITLLQTQAVENGATIARLAEDVRALTEQVRQMNGTPVVATTSSPTTPSTSGGDRDAAGLNDPAAPPTQGATPPNPPSEPDPPAASPTPEPEPRPATPIPFPCSTVFVPLLCTQGAP